LASVDDEIQANGELHAAFLNIRKVYVDAEDLECARHLLTEAGADVMSASAEEGSLKQMISIGTFEDATRQLCDVDPRQSVGKFAMSAYWCGKHLDEAAFEQEAPSMLKTRGIGYHPEYCVEKKKHRADVQALKEILRSPTVSRGVPWASMLAPLRDGKSSAKVVATLSAHTIVSDTKVPGGFLPLFSMSQITTPKGIARETEVSRLRLSMERDACAPARAANGQLRCVAFRQLRVPDCYLLPVIVMVVKSDAPAAHLISALRSEVRKQIGIGAKAPMKLGLPLPCAATERMWRQGFMPAAEAMVPAYLGSCGEGGRGCACLHTSGVGIAWGEVHDEVLELQYVPEEACDP